MELNAIKNRINANKKLVECDNLLLPSEKDKEIADLAITHILGYKPLDIPSLEQSTYDIEICKSFSKLGDFFGRDVLIEAQGVVGKIAINKTLSSGQYSSTFKLQGQLPWSLNVPANLNNLSHIYIGHELIHLLKDTNSSEWRNLLRYTEVLPQLYEFIQMKYRRVGVRRNIIDFRLNQLQMMLERVIEASKNPYFLNNESELEWYCLPELSYFISFYYSTLLYSIYMSWPNGVLKEMKAVLLHKKTTKELLENFDIYDEWDLFAFGESYQKIMKKQA